MTWFETLQISCNGGKTQIPPFQVPTKCGFGCAVKPPTTNSTGKKDITIAISIKLITKGCKICVWGVKYGTRSVLLKF